MSHFQADYFHAFAALKTNVACLLHNLYGNIIFVYTYYIVKYLRIYSEFYKKVTSLKTKGKTVLLALGGWNDSAGM
jgi:hypothetical protein